MKYNIKYDIDFYISKVESLPEDSFCTGNFKNDLGQRCINGQCGVYDTVYDAYTALRRYTAESMTLVPLFNLLPLTESGGCSMPQDTGNYSRRAAYVNNGYCKEYRQVTIRGRLLAAFYDIKHILLALKEAESILSNSAELELA